MKAMAYSLIARTSVNVYATQFPSDEEWDAYLRYRIDHIHRIETVLVYTQGGIADIRQRERMNQLGPRILNVKGAVVTSSAYIRATYRARLETHSTFHVFSEKEWDEAFHHLDIVPSNRPSVFHLIETLAKEVGLPEFIGGTFGRE